MKLKYYFDAKTYRILASEKLFVVCGWCFSLDKRKVTYTVKINGSEVDFEKKKVSRKDVQLKYTKYDLEDAGVGFRFKIPVAMTVNPERLQIIAHVGKEKQEIFSLNHKQIENIIDEKTLNFSMDSISVERKQDIPVFRLRGWACSYNRGHKILFKITDGQNNLVSFTNRPLNRDDLYRAGLVSKEERYCGFQIEFTGAENQEYTFFMSDGTMKVKKRLNAAEIEKKESFLAKQGYVKNVIYNLNVKNIKKGVTYLQKNGIRKLIERIKKGKNANGLPYEEWYESNKITKEELKKQRTKKFEKEPKISIIVPTYNTPISFFEEMVSSVQGQTYSNWELCLGDGSEGNPQLEAVMEKYHQNDPRIKYKILDKNMGISGNTNGALELATGDYIGLLDHDDVLEPHALYEVVKALNEDDYDIIYTDEDKVSGDLSEHSDPNFKPDYSPDLFCSHNYITHFFVVKKSIMDQIGGFNSEYDGAQDYDLMFRCIENSKKIKHIAKILYNWRMHAASVAGDPSSKMYAYEAGRKAIEDHYKRVGIPATVEHTEEALWGMYHTVYETPGNPLVSVVIPNKDHIEDLDVCIKSLYNNNVYQNFEIIVIENNSTDDETFEYYKKLEEEHENVKVVYWKDEFNYAAINNYGVSFAKGDYLLFLNNDTEIINDTAVRELLGCCMREDVGVVGAKLLYEDDTVQHAGIVIGFGGFAGHVFTGIGKDDYGFMVRPRINCNYSAVTAACMMVDRKSFEEVHGFTEEFKVGLNDVDFCLKVRKTGKLVVYNAFSLWHHYESKSRGYEDTKEKIERFEGEVRLFQERWPEILKKGDPYYNKNFPIEYGPFRLG
ncbi:MAG: glycosyltransferase family 2 protein [Hespellia sp.]|nr:glycosyltransferase family 2 protein [Hespellia sp.]